MVAGDRMRKHTDDDVQAEIDAEAQRQVASLRGASPEALSRRLMELRGSGTSSGRWRSTRQA